MYIIISHSLCTMMIWNVYLGPNQTNSKTHHYGDHWHSTHFNAVLHRSLSRIFWFTWSRSPARCHGAALLTVFTLLFAFTWGNVANGVAFTAFAPGLSNIPCPTAGKHVNWERGLFFCCLGRDVSSGNLFVWFHHLRILLWRPCRHKSSTKTKWILNSIHHHHNKNTLHDHNGHHHNP